jgi:hypothetical protein
MTLPDFFLVTLTALAILYGFPIALLCGVLVATAVGDGVITILRTLRRQ